MRSLISSVLRMLELVSTTSAGEHAQTLEQSRSPHALQDYQTAPTDFKKLAEQGNAEAQFNLGAMYDNGQGVPKDDVQAVA